MLNEYASRFYLLLEQAVRLDAQEKIAQMRILSYPYMDEEGRTQLMNRYKAVAFETDELLPDDETVKLDRERLRRVLKKTNG